MADIIRPDPIADNRLLTQRSIRPRTRATRAGARTNTSAISGSASMMKRFIENGSNSWTGDYPGAINQSLQSVGRAMVQAANSLRGLGLTVMYDPKGYMAYEITQGNTTSFSTNMSRLRRAMIDGIDSVILKDKGPMITGIRNADLPTRGKIQNYSEVISAMAMYAPWWKPILTWHKFIGLPKSFSEKIASRDYVDKYQYQMANKDFLADRALYNQVNTKAKYDEFKKNLQLQEAKLVARRNRAAVLSAQAITDAETARAQRSFPAALLGGIRQGILGRTQTDRPAFGDDGIDFEDVEEEDVFPRPSDRRGRQSNGEFAAVRASSRAASRQRERTNSRGRSTAPRKP